jgi:hypothetical protein
MGTQKLKNEGIYRIINFAARAFPSEPLKILRCFKALLPRKQVLKYIFKRLPAKAQIAYAVLSLLHYIIAKRKFIKSNPRKKGVLNIPKPLMNIEDDVEIP